MSNMSKDCDHIIGYDDDYEVGIMLTLKSDNDPSTDVKFKYCPLCGENIWNNDKKLLK